VGKVTAIKRTINAELTKTQEKFWNVLQEEENRVLPIRELCHMVGYRSMGPWYYALQDAAFRARVEGLGVPIHRQASHRDTVLSLTENPDEEWRKDFIDIRRLVTEYPKHRGAGSFQLDFSCISHPKMRGIIKRYFRARIGFWEPRSFSQALGDMKPFFLALGEKYPEIETFADLTRPMIEPFLTLPTWKDQRGRIHAISSHKKLHMVCSLGVMFTYMQQHAWEEAPTCILIYDEDRPKLAKRRPRPIPQPVFEQLQLHLHLLPPYARNLVEILSVAGLRAEDAMHLPEDCLEHDAAGDPRLHWFNFKMKRDGRPLPVTTSVAEAVQRQRELVKEVPDLFNKRYLFRTKRGLYQFIEFCKHLNQLAQQVPILGLDGQVYRFKPHAFRHMVGTQMINNGMGIADVMVYLDHMSPEMTLQYAEIDDDKLKQKFKALVLSGQAVGGVALKALKERLEKGDESELDWVVSNLRKLSLPWGQCLHHAKSNKCPYGQNACFTKDNGPCHKLVTTPEHAPVIIATLDDLKRSRQIADEKGWEMYANDLADQINGMQQVLDELQLPADQRPKNRGGLK
jgi:integrase